MDGADMVSQTNIALAELYSIDSIRGALPKNPDLSELKSKAAKSEDPGDIYACAKAAKLRFLTHGGNDESLPFLEAAAAKGIEDARADLDASNLDSDDSSVRSSAMNDLAELAKNSPRAQFLLAVQYLGGGHIQKNEPKAVSLLKKAARGNLAVARSRLGARFYNEAVINNDSRLMAKAAGLFESAKDQDHGAALCHIAHMVSAGTGGYQKDVSRAVSLYRQSSELGFAYAKKALGLLFVRGIAGAEGTKEEGYRMLDEFDASLADGEVKCMIADGIMARSFSKDELARAFRLFSESVNLGFAPAFVRLGSMYESGLGCAANRETAGKLYEQGARLGDAKAAAKMGYFILDNGPDKLSLAEMDRAFAYMNAGARGGEPSAMSFVAEMEEQQAGCLTAHAELMYKEGAKRGNAACQFRVAVMYQKGEGACPADMNECAKWLALATAQNHKRAKEMLESIKN